MKLSQIVWLISAVFAATISIGSTSWSKKEVLDLGDRLKATVETTKNQLLNDPENIKSNGTIAQQFAEISSQIESLIDLLETFELDQYNYDDQMVITSFYEQLYALQLVNGKAFDQYSHEAIKYHQLERSIVQQRTIATDYRDHYANATESLTPVVNQFDAIVKRLDGVDKMLRYNEKGSIITVQKMKVLNMFQPQVEGITKQLQSLCAKYPKD